MTDLTKYADTAVFMAGLKEEMALAGINQAALARQARKSAPEINRWFRGVRRPSLMSMMVMENAVAEIRHG